MMLGTNSDIPVSIMGLVSTYLASFFLFCKLPFKWYLAIFLHFRVTLQLCSFIEILAIVLVGVQQR